MAFFFIISGALLRIASHLNWIDVLPNFAPIAAMALFGGVYLNKKYALIIPLIAMLVADYFIGFYNIWLMLAVYGSFASIGLIGLWVKNNKTIANITGATLLGSVLFFLITNFAMWAIQPLMPQVIYPQTLQGLIDCYTMGLPFFRGTLMGDMFYVGMMFGTMELAIYIKKKVFIKKLA